MGTVVNRALPYFYGGSLEITLTVPLNTIILSIYILQINMLVSFKGTDEIISSDTASKEIHARFKPVCLSNDDVVILVFLFKK